MKVMTPRGEYIMRLYFVYYFVFFFFGTLAFVVHTGRRFVRVLVILEYLYFGQSGGANAIRV